MRKLLEKFGIIYILHGISMLHHRQIRPFVLAPLLINILIFALATWYVWNRGSELSEYLEFELPCWRGSSPPPSTGSWPPRPRR